MPSASRARRTAIVAALLGAFASLYLLIDYVFGSGICLTGSGCDLVRASAFAYPLGIPTPLLGTGFYLGAIPLLLASPSRRLGPMTTGAVAVGWAMAGVAVMAFLTAVELFVVRALCSWCLVSAVASVGLLVGALGARRDADPTSRGRSSREQRRAVTEQEVRRRGLQRFTALSAAVLGGGLVALLALPTLTATTPPLTSGDAADGRPRLGTGPIEVLVYSDFQCPACATAAPILSTLAEQGAVTLTYRYFPLASIHPNAVAAAEAAEAASRQDAFWEFHDALFAEQTAWSSLRQADALTAFARIASDIGLDTAQWRSDVTSDAVREAVAADRLAAERLQLSGTPTVFIDGLRYDGPLSPEFLAAAVSRAASE